MQNGTACAYSTAKYCQCKLQNSCQALPVEIFLAESLNTFKVDYCEYTAILVREAEVILLTFSKGKSILLLNCSLDVQ